MTPASTTFDNISSAEPGGPLVGFQLSLSFQTPSVAVKVYVVCP